MPGSGQRARLTLPDFILLLFGIAILGALYPVFWQLFSANVAIMEPGSAYLFQLILPLLLLVMFTLLYRTAIRGLG